MRYTVIGLVDATTVEDVEASSPEEAIDRAEMHASVCHQCSGKIEVGDVIGFRVLDADGEEVYSDESANLHLATVEELKAEIAKRRRNARAK